MDKKMIAWHSAVRKKYKNICQGCSKWFPDNECGGHHVKSKGSHPELKYEVSNGLCVHVDCHDEIHRGLKKAIGENGEYEVIKN